MRRQIVKWVAELPSDVYSFIAGALFSILIALAAERFEFKSLSSPHALVILGAFAVSTFGFLKVGSTLKKGEGDAARSDDPERAKREFINNRLESVFAYIVLTAVAPFAIAIYILFH